MEVLRDNLGRIIGRIRTFKNGDQEVYDEIGRFLGRYNKRTNETRDNLGRVIGSGNQLTRLL